MSDLVGNPEYRFSHNEAHMVQSLSFLYPKFQASSHLQQYSPVVVGLVGNREDMFSRDATQ